MPLNRDDIISEAAVSGSRGITCDSATLFINPISRNIRVDFNLVKITVLDDNTVFREQLMPISADLTDGTGTKTFTLYNRRTGVPLASGQTRTYDALTRDLMSLFFATAANASVT